ncbi:anti-sigma factor domain-containing protein [Streptomyces sp. NPDC088745]|uniref:anti-sigma factor n=1 Tax=Streptomyces sp. NPDC088745 TaxID=3365884 RepID=UPI0038295A26
MKLDESDAHALVAAYVLGALEAGERGAFEDHLQACETCQMEAAEFEATAARLAAAVALPPPTAAKAQVMAAIDGVRQSPPRIPGAAAPALGGVLRRKALPLALAASVAAAVFGGTTVWQLRDGQELRQQARQAQQQLDAVSAVLAAPDARSVRGRAANGATVTIVASKRQNGAVLTATSLPALGAGKIYQLWLDYGGTMRPAGFIDGDGTVVLTGDPADAGAVGLTLEPAGGSPQPTSAPLLLMSLPA